MIIALTVIRDEAGKADVGVKISGPKARSSVPFNITATERGDHVTYVAKETGTYVIDVTYGRLAVPGRYNVTWSSHSAEEGPNLF